MFKFKIHVSYYLKKIIYLKIIDWFILIELFTLKKIILKQLLPKPVC